MKKVIVAIVIVVLHDLKIGGMIFIKQTKNKQEEELNKHLITLSGSEFKEKIENKESFILIITGSNCSHCEGYKPTFKQVLHENDLYAYEVVQDTLNNEDLAYLKNISSISGTPTIVFINNGEETSTYNRIVGNVSKAKTTERLKTLGYIK